MPRFDADWIDSMLRPQRRGTPPAEETLDQLGLAPGQIVADVGCGPGFYAIPAAARVAPDGRVYAVDLEPRMLALVEERAVAAGLGAVVEARQGDARVIPLDARSADTAICALVLHDLVDRAGLVAELYRVVRPGGHVAVAEWTPEPDDSRPNRLRPDQTAALLTEAGFDLVRQRPLGTAQYLIVSLTLPPG